MAASSIPCGNDALVVGVYNICIDGYDLGSTTGGVTVSRSAEYVDVRNDQSCTRQYRYLRQQDWSFSTTLQSVTLDKVRVIYGIPEMYVDANGVDFPSMPDANTLIFSESARGCGIAGAGSFPVQICGPGPGCGCRIMTFPQVVATPESLDYTISKENPIQLEVEFTILADCVTGEIGTWVDGCDSAVALAVECSSDPIPTNAAPTA